MNAAAARFGAQPPKEGIYNLARGPGVSRSRLGPGRAARSRGKGPRESAGRDYPAANDPV